MVRRWALARQRRLLSCSAPAAISRAAWSPSPHTPICRCWLVPAADERLFSDSVQPELREMFRLLANPIAKHVGVDLGVYGIQRKDRLPPSDPVAVTAWELATALGFKDLDVFVSTRNPYVMVAEPTHPVSLVLGAAITHGESSGIKFAAGAALKLAKLSLAIPARVSTDDLGVLGLALLRLFHPELTSSGVNLDSVKAQLAKLRRLVPASVLEEVRPHVAAVDSFHHQAFARDLKIAGLRAGFAASGSLLPGLSILAASLGTDLSNVVADPIVQKLIFFALGEPRNADVL